MARRYTELWPKIANKDNVHKGLRRAVENKRKVGSIARVLEDEENKVVFKLSNRNKDMDLLKQTLTRIGYQDRIKDIQEDECYIFINTASFDANEIADKSRDLIKRISG